MSRGIARCRRHQPHEAAQTRRQGETKRTASRYTPEKRGNENNNSGSKSDATHTVAAASSSGGGSLYRATNDHPEIVCGVVARDLVPRQRLPAGGSPALALAALRQPHPVLRSSARTASSLHSTQHTRTLESRRLSPATPPATHQLLLPRRRHELYACYIIASARCMSVSPSSSSSDVTAGPCMQLRQPRRCGLAPALHTRLLRIREGKAAQIDGHSRTMCE